MTDSLSVILEITSGVYDGAVYKLQSFPIKIGRAYENDVAIPFEVPASRNHAQIIKDGYQISLVDLNSTNGTFLNESKVSDKKDLMAGDIIRIGSVKILCSFAYD